MASDDLSGGPPEAVVREGASLTAGVVDALGMSAEPRQRRRLRRMKRGAGLLLLVVAAIWVLSYFIAPNSGGAGFARAAAEAAMVGGLADWFAVTALFRHPLHLPIPHTALIPTKKDELAANLGQFITDHFLSAESMRAQIRSAEVLSKTAQWVALPDNAALVSRQLVLIAGRAVADLNHDAVAGIVTRLLRAFVRSNSVSASVGHLVTSAVKTRAHDQLVGQVLRVTLVAIDVNRGALEHWVEMAADRFHIIAGWIASGPPSRRLVEFAESTLADAAGDRDHWVRKFIDEVLRDLGTDLEAGGESARSVDNVARALADDPSMNDWMRELVVQIAQSLQSSLISGDEHLVGRVSEILQTYASRTLQDEAFRAGLELRLEDGVAYLVEQHGHQFKELIQNKVKLWSPEETAQRFELAVGRDLQFIRINGTVVGGLAGVAIHAVSLFLA